MKFPLGQGHRFGYRSTDLRTHFPGSNVPDQEVFRQFQHHLMLVWQSDLVPNGQYDGSTQRVIFEIQRVSGLPMTGFVDQDTWEAAYSRTPPQTAPESTESAEKPEVVVETTPEVPDAPRASETVVADDGPDTIPASPDPAVSAMAHPSTPEVRRGPGRPKGR